MRGVRSVVGGNGVHSTVRERDQNCFAVRGRAQRRVHLEVGVVFAHVFVEQREMVRRYFAGDAGLGALAAAHRLERVGSGKMRDVQSRFPNLLRQIDVAVHDVRFGGGGHAAQAETKAGRPFVHGTAFGEARVLSMLHHRQIQFSAQPQGRAHNFVIEDGLAIVGDGHSPGAL